MRRGPRMSERAKTRRAKVEFYGRLRRQGMPPAKADQAARAAAVRHDRRVAEGKVKDND